MSVLFKTEHALTVEELIDVPQLVRVPISEAYKKHIEEKLATIEPLSAGRPCYITNSGNTVHVSRNGDSGPCACGNATLPPVGFDVAAGEFAKASTECTCKSLLNGHEHGCKLASK